MVITEGSRHRYFTDFFFRLCICRPAEFPTYICSELGFEMVEKIVGEDKVSKPSQAPKEKNRAKEGEKATFVKAVNGSNLFTSRPIYIFRLPRETD